MYVLRQVLGLGKTAFVFIMEMSLSKRSLSLARKLRRRNQNDQIIVHVYVIFGAKASWNNIVEKGQV